MQLHELRDRVSALPALESKMEQLVINIQKARDEVSGLLHRYKGEKRDVERIRKQSLSAFVYRLIGRYEDKLEKERREEITAKLAYDRAAMRLESLERERDALAARIGALREDRQTYQAELAGRRHEMANMSGESLGMPYAELENERGAIISRMTDIEEALSAAGRADIAARNALESLKKADNWATYDLFTRGGIISHMNKYSHIDSAEREFHSLSSELRSLKTELDDIPGLRISSLGEISSVRRAVDLWFDNIFTDLSIRGQIRDNTNEVIRLLKAIKAAESALSSRLGKEKLALADNSRREEELLLSLR